MRRGWSPLGRRRPSFLLPAAGAHRRPAGAAERDGRDRVWWPSRRWRSSLYAVALVLAVGAAARPAAGGAGAALPVALVAVAGLVLHGWWFAPQFTGANPPPADGATPIVVMTANLRRARPTASTSYAPRADADVDLLVLEEVTPAVLADMDRAGLADLLPVPRRRARARMASGTMAFSPAARHRRRAAADDSAAGASRWATSGCWRCTRRTRSTPPAGAHDQAASLARVADERPRPGRGRLQRHRRPRVDAGARRRRLPRRRRAGQRRLAADLADQRRVLGVLGRAAGADRPRPGRGAAGRARHARPSPSPAATTAPWSPPSRSK